MNKVALIIGNDEYQYINKLRCAVKDSRDIKSKLEMLGFKTQAYENIKSDDRIRITKDLNTLINNAEIGLFYFAGHGFEINKTNYLLTTDVTIDENICKKDFEMQMKYNEISLDDIINSLQDSGLNTKIIILDVCRDSLNNDVGRGLKEIPSLAPVTAKNGMIICYATSPGQKALENDRNGYYTESILSMIDKTPNMSIETLFKRVRVDVNTKTEGRQVPWEHTSLISDFSFYPIKLDGTYITNYSYIALADELYKADDLEIGKEIIDDLKSHNFYTQNSSIFLLKSKLKSHYDFSKDDLFVIGRNIYQSSVGGAFDASSFIENFHTYEYNDEVMFHLLNGMSYEIYFNSKGKIRNSFKSEKFSIIKTLFNNEKFEKSKNFIVSKIFELDIPLYKYNDHPDDVLIMNVEIEKQTEEGKYLIKSMKLNGRYVDIDCEEEDSIDDVYRLEKFEEYIKDSLCTEDLHFFYNVDNRIDIEKLVYNKFSIFKRKKLKYTNL